MFFRFLSDEMIFVYSNCEKFREFTKQAADCMWSIFYNNLWIEEVKTPNFFNKRIVSILSSTRLPVNALNLFLKTNEANFWKSQILWKQRCFFFQIINWWWGQRKYFPKKYVFSSSLFLFRSSETLKWIVHINNSLAQSNHAVLHVISIFGQYKWNWTTLAKVFLPSSIFTTEDCFQLSKNIITYLLLGEEVDRLFLKKFIYKTNDFKDLGQKKWKTQPSSVRKPKLRRRCTKTSDTCQLFSLLISEVNFLFFWLKHYLFDYI